MRWQICEGQRITGCCLSEARLLLLVRVGALLPVLRFPDRRRCFLRCLVHIEHFVDNCALGRPQSHPTLRYSHWDGPNPNTIHPIIKFIQRTFKPTCQIHPLKMMIILPSESICFVFPFFVFSPIQFILLLPHSIAINNKYF